MDRASTNGGFPLPPDSEPVRLVHTRHDACGGETRVRLPGTVPARAVRRVVCERCAVAFEATATDAASTPARLIGLPRPSRPWRESAWRWISIPLAGALVFAALSLIQGGDDVQDAPEAQPAPSSADAAEARGAGDDSPRVVDVTGGRAAKAAAAENAQLVSESTYTLALPAGWDRVSAQGGATFAAVAPGGEADATLWVERDPTLDFAAFEARSLDQLEQLAGSAKVVERTTGPTPEATTIRIAAEAPAGAPRYEAVLRAATGDYWYYLATTVQPGASNEAIEAVELLQGSFVPEGAAG